MLLSFGIEFISLEMRINILALSTYTTACAVCLPRLTRRAGLEETVGPPGRFSPPTGPFPTNGCPFVRVPSHAPSAPPPEDLPPATTVPVLRAAFPVSVPGSAPSPSGVHTPALALGQERPGAVPPPGPTLWGVVSTFGLCLAGSPADTLVISFGHVTRCGQTGESKGQVLLLSGTCMCQRKVVWGSPSVCGTCQDWRLRVAHRTGTHGQGPERSPSRRTGSA